MQGEFWYKNTLIGKIKKIYFKMLYKKYKFDEWHCTPVNFRLYAQELIAYINSQVEKNPEAVIVEVGCGLGEIVGNIREGVRFGYDISKEVLQAAKALNKRVKYRRGTFPDVRIKNIDYLITVNFIHGIDEDALRRDYKELIKRCQPKYIVVDEVRSKKYLYNHSFKNILPKNYTVVKKLGKFPAYGGIRYIYIYKQEAQA